MTKVALETVGCRLNQYETGKIADSLIRLGLRRVSYKEKADIYILNTCTVTGRADADCRKLINRACRLNKQAVVVVTGCYAVSEPEVFRRLDGVDLIVSNDDKMRLPDILRESFPHLFPSSGSADSHAVTIGENGVVSDKAVASPNRAMVKIGDGCNQNCSYCIVPKVRGRLVSRRPGDIIDEINRKVADGYHEVVLTAVHIGRYTSDGMNLAGLIDRILAGTDLSRLRLSSIEPNEIDNRILNYIACEPRLCRHLHMPLQSGSDRILGMMRRPYSSNDYLDVVGKIKAANPEITIGCDLIVGFPGETDDDFARSLAVLESGHIDYGHIFSYSDRLGTEASNLPDKIDSSVIKERNRAARLISEHNRQRHMRRQVGKILGVISEHRPNKGDGYFGVSDNYLKVRMPLNTGGRREIVRFKPVKRVGDHLEGDIVYPDK